LILIERLIVIGTGLMGASVAAAAKAHQVAKDVVGIDAVGASAAQSLGFVDASYASLASVPESAGLTGIVVATPVTAMPHLFEEIEAFNQRQPVAWATDIASSKAGVIKAATHFVAMRSRFVSSHPMTGSEKQGAAHASAALFNGARVLICKFPDTAEQTMLDVEAFWVAIGGQPNQLPLEDHDPLLAVISHLPHALAFSLAGSIGQSSLAGVAQALHGGGLRDTTRVAASSPELWADIFLDNRESLLAAWQQWSLHQQALLTALEQSDRAMLIDLMDRAAHWRRGF
jgi:prephenate dehydrogenase